MSEALPWSIPRIGSKGRTIEGWTPQSEARLVLCKAKTEARELKQRLLISVREEAQFIREQAREDGFSEGYQAGMERAVQELAERSKRETDRLQAQLDQFLHREEEAMTGFLEQVSVHLTDMALSVCEAMLDEVPGRELPIKKIRQAIDTIADGGDVIVRIGPDDCSDWASHQSLKVVRDDELGTGDFVLEGRAGVVDGRWETRWRRAKEVLEDGRL